MVVAPVAENRAVYVSITYNGPVYIKHSRVIPETVSVPSSSIESVAPVSIAIINTAIKAYGWTPIACVEAIKAAGKAPVRGGPQNSDFGRRYPNAWYPVVAIVGVISPISGLP